MRRAPPVRTIEHFTFFHVREVMRRLKLSRRMVMREIETGRMPAKKIGACWYVRDKWLEGWIQNALDPNKTWVNKDGECVWLSIEEARDYQTEREAHRRAYMRLERLLTG